MSDFWLASIPAVVLFVLLGACVFMLANQLRQVVRAVSERLEKLSTKVPPARVVELEELVKKLLAKFGELEQKQEDWQEDQYRKVQRYHTLINSKLRHLPGAEEPEDQEVQEILDKVKDTEPVLSNAQASQTVSVKRQLRDQYFANRPKGAPF